MCEALDGHEDSVSIGGQLITNFRFVDDIVVNAEEEEELASWSGVSIFHIKYETITCFYSDIRACRVSPIQINKVADSKGAISNQQRCQNPLPIRCQSVTTT